MLPSRAFTAYDESTFGRFLPAASARRRPGFLVRRDREVDDDDLSHGALLMGVSGDSMEKTNRLELRASRRRVRTHGRLLGYGSK